MFEQARGCCVATGDVGLSEVVAMGGRWLPWLPRLLIAADVGENRVAAVVEW